jgi:glutaredoxin
MPHLELFGSAQCPYTRDLREWLEWTRREFCEYNVDTDPEAYARLQSFTGGSGAVPVLVEDGKVTQIGWQGRSCVTGAPLKAPDPS